MENPYLSVIIPAFNEEMQIASSLTKIVDYLGEQPFVWEIASLEAMSVELLNVSTLSY